MPHVSDYVDHALLAAQAEQGRLVLNVQRINFRDLLQEMIDIYALLAATEEREIDMRCNTDCWIQADRKYLKQIFHNLLTNALKHGRGTIRIHLKKRGAFVVCTVLNRVGDRKGRSIAGVGLGLRLIKALAASHKQMDFRTKIARWGFAARLSTGVDGALKAGHASSDGVRRVSSQG